MAVLESPPRSEILTYEKYLDEGVIEGSYEIINGVRIFMASPSWPHQKKNFTIATILNNYAVTSKSAEMILAPFDVLIRRRPKLQTRQPDVFLISYRRGQG